ncbi:hypothetical protein EU524_01865 [Candidatus Thorarchaeota archaeon]|jgi:hypothetical protein|nr:MAG: hypothetical protein EU524_01865 [Candidatus Thorarchaeota archaeon]
MVKPPTEEPRLIECKEDGHTMWLSVGDEFYVQFHRHGSVGEDAEFEISDEGVVTHIRTEAEYLHPERMKPGWTGGDAERGRWFFRAEKPGETKFTIRILFRFNVESTCTMTLVVD